MFPISSRNFGLSSIRNAASSFTRRPGGAFSVTIRVDMRSTSASLDGLERRFFSSSSSKFDHKMRITHPVGSFRYQCRSLSFLDDKKQKDEETNSTQYIYERPDDDKKQKDDQSNSIKYVYEKPDDEKPPDNPTPPKSRTGMMVSIGLGASFLFGKLKFVLIGLKLTKAAPLISMVISSAAYSFIFGWPYAIGMVGLIFVHECGHALVMMRYGLPFSPMVFIPFMGAVIAMEKRPKNSYEEAIIAFGGPVLGSAAALTVAAAGAVTGNQMLFALADWGLLINLFNLLPIGSMDGGRICGAISPYIGVVGLSGGGAMIYYGVVSNPIFYLIMMAGTYQTFSRFMGWEEESEDYYRISGVDQASLFAAYVALIGGLILAMRENNRSRKTPKQLQYEMDSPWEVLPEPWQQNDDGVYDDFFPVSDDKFT